ncbi:MAG: hypothetical protein IPK60_13240 [Sandaracinaceae bacterium]|jgi:hypothetical protein|nr:hypothetical protein [Sandaracinaceae bacterium]
MTRSFLTALFCVSLALSSSACGFSFAADAFVSNRCGSASDCGDSESCDETRGMCVSRAPAPLRVALEVVPPNSSTAAGAIFSVAPVSISDATELDVTMPDPLLVWGLVRWQNHGEQNVPVQISVVPASVIPGHISPAVPAMHASGSFHPELLDTAFVANVGVQGSDPARFDLIIRPTGAAAAELPPRRIHAFAEGAADGAYQVPGLDYPEHLVEIIGDVVDASGDPLPGLTVQAIDTASGEVVSSTALTQDLSSETPGRFLIRLAPEAGSYNLRIASSETALQPMPTFAVSPDYLLVENDVVRVRVNTTSTFVFQGVVESDFFHEPVPGALVQFRMTNNPTDDGTFISAPVRTGSEGEFSLLLVNGTYEIVITPPSDAVNGHNMLGVSVVQNVHIETPVSGVPGIMGQVFSLPQRAELTGSVMTSDGRPMIGATIEAAALGRLLDGVGPATALNRSNQTVTDDDGLFALALDLGMYDLTLKPPAESGFPWIVRTNFSIPPIDGVTEEMLMFNAPIPLHGVVRDRIGTPLANVELRAFAVFDMVDGGLRSVQIGRAISESDGTYELLLPPQL